MTIDEAIRDFRHLESDFEHAMCDIEDTKENLIMYQEKWEYCKQIAEWLQELKAYKENEFDVLKQDGQLLYKQGVVDGYDKAVDDLVEKCKSAMFSEGDEITLSDIHQGVNSGLSMAIHFAGQSKEAIQSNVTNMKKDNRWIPCSEKLPEESLNSVIGWDEYRKRCVFIQYVQGKFQNMGTDDSFNITAWRPLPEPYKEEDEKSDRTGSNKWTRLY